MSVDSQILDDVKGGLEGKREGGWEGERVHIQTQPTPDFRLSACTYIHMIS